MSSGAASLAQPGGGGQQDPESEYGQDQVVVFSHEGDGENTEHLNSMDLHDVKTELEKDAEKAETPKSAASATTSPGQITIATTSSGIQPNCIRPIVQHPTMVYANGSAVPFMVPPFAAGTPALYPVTAAGLRPVKMECSDWSKVSQGQIIPAYSYPAGFLPVESGLRQAYPFMIPGQYVTAPYQHQLTALGQPVAPNATVQPHSGIIAPQVKDKKPHIKKPLNAFMLFMKEKRADVIKECTLKESAAINQILGKMWHALDRGEQAKYYEKAREERARHMQMYPGWSARDNYAVHKKRRKRKVKAVEKSEDEEGACDPSDPNSRKCRARYGLDQQQMWCGPCRRKKKCVRYSEDDEDAPKEMHGALEDDVIGTPTKNSEDCAINSNGYSSSAATVTVATISETKTGIKSESSSYGQDTPTISHQSELSVPITLQTIPT